MTTTLQRARAAGGRPVSGAALAFFRIAFGVAMLINAALYLRWRVHAFYVEPSFYFPFEPFRFVEPLPEMGMYAVFVSMGVAGALIALGLWYRWAVAAYFVLKTYVFLIESSYFQNHDYLIVLLAFLLLFLPADRMWSVDALRKPHRAAPTVPAWTLWILRFQIGIPYFFGGVAKLNPDWLQGEPLRMWLARSVADGDIHTVFTNETVVWIMAYGSLLFDLVVVGFLLHPRTRVAAFLVATGFHLFNAYLFGLIIFPWLMIAATTVFFAADWPMRAVARLDRLAEKLRRKASSPTPKPLSAAVAADPETLPGIDATHGPTAASATTSTRLRPWLTACLAGWIAVQSLLPLRHLVIPGSPNWTEQGHRFAWHMKLRDKQGTAIFHVTTAEGDTFSVDPGDHLTHRQAYKIVGHPERLVRFAKHLADLHDGTEVRAETSVSLNGRDPAPLVDPDVDLTTVTVTPFGRPEWILPLDQPLRR